MELMLGISILLNVLLCVLVVARELDHQEYERRQKHLNLSLKDELMNYIREGRLL